MQGADNSEIETMNAEYARLDEDCKRLEKENTENGILLRRGIDLLHERRVKLHSFRALKEYHHSKRQ